MTDVVEESGGSLRCGAHWDGRGVSFGLFSAHAEQVELCLFDVSGEREVRRVPMDTNTSGIWRVYVPDAKLGQLYGYRVHGPYAPDAGHRFNHHKLLIDPYARMLSGRFQWNDALFGYRRRDPDGDLSFDTRDSAPFVPKCQVVDPQFDWGADRPPGTPWGESVIYELNVRGFTMRNGLVPTAQRGTFAGLASPTVVRYLQDLGVTAVELLPVHAFLDEFAVFQRGLRNFWGYNSVGFFAAEARYGAMPDIAEFKRLVQAMHAARIEVILDVVYNHTGEGDQLGPTISFRGIDNATYYRLRRGSPRYYDDVTGCGSTVDTHQPVVQALVRDSLKYWVEEMHVDGFRLDLAVALGRDQDGQFDPRSGLMAALSRDPDLARIKLIAEPWDDGPGGYRLGQFPPAMSEWNDRYRDAVRRFWRGDSSVSVELARRLMGSADIFDGGGRHSWSSINFVTVHDGFTLADLVSYATKHNEANGENNRDGADDNRSWNCGVEGSTTDPQIRLLRRRQQRNMLASLLLSRGLPLLLAGDEFGRTQGGNNNAYCQDNNVGWLDWECPESDDGASLLAFTRRLLRLRRANEIFAHSRARPADGGDQACGMAWLRPDGRELALREGEADVGRCVGWWLRGGAGSQAIVAELGAVSAPHPDQGGPDRSPAEGREVDWFLLLNAEPDAVAFTLPTLSGAGWQLIMDTALAEPFTDGDSAAHTTFRIGAHSTVLLSAVVPRLVTNG